jgi:hypothetical protein
LPPQLETKRKKYDVFGERPDITSVNDPLAYLGVVCEPRFTVLPYSKYEFPVDKWKVVFDRLLEVKDKLEKEEIRPTKDNVESNFPSLETLLK